ncbi:MAG TPA: protein kinase [Polyangiales bacterium]|nr:protein kinase [Polyangiales bacterium]
MSANATVESQSTNVDIGSGVLVGGRFLVEAAGASTALGQTFLARDQKTKKPIAVYVASDALAGDRNAVEIFRNEARSAAKLRHRNLVGIYGVGAHGGRQQFIAQEWLPGQNAADLIGEHKRDGKPLSVRGVYNLVAHVCKALTAIHEVSIHGALRPQVVWISKSGRVKVGELGVAATLAKTRRYELLSAEEQAFLAPEARTGGNTDARADVFGAGALLYALLTARSPLETFVPPSQARSDATPELDAILMRCLATDPALRFAKPDELMAALLPLCADAPEPEMPDFDMEIEVDVDVAHSLMPRPGPRMSAPPASMPPIEISIGPTVPPPPSNDVTAVAVRSPAPPVPPVPSAARTADRPSPHPQPRPASPIAPPMAAGPLAAPQPAPVAQAAGAATGGDDLAALTARLTQNDAPRWMAVKDGMDHGPFTARELIKLIVDGEILEQHLVFTLSSAERKPLVAYPEFSDFIHQYKIRKDEKDYGEALARSTKNEKRSTAAKALILTASIGAVLVVGLGYMMSRRAAEKAEHQAEVDLATLYDNGQVKISGTAGILTHTPRAPGARRTGGGPSPGGGTGFTSYEDAMNTAMEIGDARQGGGERQLTSGDVAGVMNRSLNRMFGCVGDELRHGGKLGRVTIDLAILGSGKVMGASVNTGTPGFQKCIATKVRELQFPNFPAPRMGARYSFAVD